MKYMGSKRWQLKNGLGCHLEAVTSPGAPFVDLFAGSGSVSWFAATELKAMVTAIDLQNYAAILSGAVIERTTKINAEKLIGTWITPLRKTLGKSSPEVKRERILRADKLTKGAVNEIRSIASVSKDPFVRAYGGHFFSIEQAALIGGLRTTLPSRRPHARVALAALISAASRCSASPGHTAQPFQPTAKALPHIESIWSKDLLNQVEQELRVVSSLHSSTKGKALVADANTFAKTLVGNEIVFVDPPYSAAQYSRFYHVLEAIAIGGYDEVSGAGRSPSLSSRRRSDFSMTSAALAAFRDLLNTLGSLGCRVVVTFPQSRASNGVSGAELADLASKWFDVDVSIVSASFSTLGGNGDGRPARRKTNELVITLRPRGARSRSFARTTAI